MPAPIVDASTLLPWQYSKPGQLRQEYAVDEVLAQAAVPGQVLAAQAPPVPQDLFPPKYGYDENPPTIDDVVNIDRWTPVRRSWTSGGSRYREQPEQPIDGAEGSLRNAYTGLGYGS
jgi:hypothetical protein